MSILIEAALAGVNLVKPELPKGIDVGVNVFVPQNYIPRLELEGATGLKFAFPKPGTGKNW